MQALSGSQKLRDPTTRALLKLLYERRHTARRLVTRHSFDAPHRKEHIAATAKWLVVRYCLRPGIKRVQIETAQEYSSEANLVECSPEFFSRCVEGDNDGRTLFKSKVGHLVIFHQP